MPTFANAKDLPHAPSIVTIHPNAKLHASLRKPHQDLPGNPHLRPAHISSTHGFVSRRVDLEIGRTVRGPMDRALINGAPVAVPVTMQFALHRDVRSPWYPVCCKCVCILGRGPGCTVDPGLARQGETTERQEGESVVRRYLQRSDKAVTRVTRWHGTDDN